ncbi:hypothetical protein VTH06DRAFT_7718 [Thermothelomyces fergusii]
MQKAIFTRPIPALLCIPKQYHPSGKTTLLSKKRARPQANERAGPVCGWSPQCMLPSHYASHNVPCQNLPKTFRPIQGIDDHMRATQQIANDVIAKDIHGRPPATRKKKKKITLLSPKPKAKQSAAFLTGISSEREKKRPAWKLSCCLGLNELAVRDFALKIVAVLSPSC